MPTDTISEYNDKIASQRLLMALRKLESILGGKAVVNRIVISLIDHGINLQDVPKSYSLEELEKGLQKIIGEGSLFVMTRLKNGLL
jgi:hypothetical protein